MNVRNTDEAVLWLQAYNDWEQRWDQFLRHRTHPKLHTSRPSGVPDRATWWYTHRDLRTTRGLFRRVIADEQLFTWIDPRLTDETTALQRTTSPLVGGPNKALKDLFPTHRGFLTEHARRAAEWKLNSLTAHAHNPSSPVRPEHYKPPPTRPKHTPLDNEPVGPAFSTDLS